MLLIEFIGWYSKEADVRLGALRPVSQSFFMTAAQACHELETIAIRSGLALTSSTPENARP